MFWENLSFKERAQLAVLDKKTVITKIKSKLKRRYFFCSFLASHLQNILTFLLDALAMIVDSVRYLILIPKYV